MNQKNEVPQCNGGGRGPEYARRRIPRDQHDKGRQIEQPVKGVLRHPEEQEDQVYSQPCNLRITEPQGAMGQVDGAGSSELTSKQEYQSDKTGESYPGYGIALEVMWFPSEDKPHCAA